MFQNHSITPSKFASRLKAKRTHQSHLQLSPAQTSTVEANCDRCLKVMMVEITFDRLVMPNPGTGPPHACIRSTPSMDQQSIASTSSCAKTMLILFHAMGHRIPKIFFDRAMSKLRRIYVQGIHHEVTPKAIDVDQPLADLLKTATFEHVMDYLISQSQISLRDGTYVCQDESVRALFGRRKLHWACQAFALCCHVFPCGPEIDLS